MAADRILFAILLLELAFFFYLAADRRMIKGHDGFDLFSVQYYFLNHAATAGEIPQWMPFMTCGVPAAYWYLFQGGIVQYLFLSAGKWLCHFNFLPLYLLGMLADNLLLLTGTWLFGKRFFSSPASLFFVCVSVMGSSVWFIQPWMNFRIYYALPLILHFLHRFLETQKWRYFFLAGNLYAFQILGNTIYFVPVTSWVIFTYFALHLAFNFRENLSRVRRLRWGMPAWISVSAVAASAVALAVMIYGWKHDLVMYGPERGADLKVPLETFLSYGGNKGLQKWWELILGFSPNWDYSLYIGLLPLPMLAFAVLFGLRDRRRLPFFILAVLIQLFSMATFLSVVLYHAWPFMPYFRHIGLLSSLVRVLLCFLAGFGLDIILAGTLSPWKKLCLAVSVFGMIFLAGFLFHAAHDPSFVSRRLFDMVTVHKLDLKQFAGIFPPQVLSFRLGRTAFFSVLASAALFLFFIPKKSRFAAAGIAGFLFVHVLNLYTYKFDESRSKMFRMNESQYSVTAFQAMPFRTNREAGFSMKYDEPRSAFLSSLTYGFGATFLPAGAAEPIKLGVNSWAVYSFVFRDLAGTSLRTNFCSPYYERFLKAYDGRPLDSPGTKTVFWLKQRGVFLFPPTLSAQKTGAVTEDKIRFFSEIFTLPDDTAIAALIRNPAYRGDILFSLPPGPEVPSARLTPWDNRPLASDNRLRFSYRVERFDANRLEVTADLEGEPSAWMFYSGIWAPGWHATVNQKPVPVLRANLAFMAVPLNRGINRIRLSYSRNFSLFHPVVALNAAFWFCWIFAALLKIFFKKEGPVFSPSV